MLYRCGHMILLVVTTGGCTKVAIKRMHVAQSQIWKVCSTDTPLDGNDITVVIYT